MDRARPWRGKAVNAQAGTPIGIFGGSFDPPHLGHVALVHAALTTLELPEVWVVPAGLPVHRQLSGCADAATRLHWLRRIFADEKRVKVLDWEAKATKPTPTIATLRRIRRQFPDVLPLLLMGEDAFAGLASWVDYPAHQQLCAVAVFPRDARWLPPLKGWRRVSPAAWRREPATGCVIRIGAALPDISATRLRAMAGAQQSLRDLVPACVQGAIEQHYRKGEEQHGTR